MSKKDKITNLLKKARKSPASVSFKELKKLVKAFGFVHDHTDGSHEQYKRHDDPYHFLNLQPREGDKKMAKIYQVRKFVQFIDDNSLEEGL